VRRIRAHPEPRQHGVGGGKQVENASLNHRCRRAWTSPVDIAKVTGKRRDGRCFVHSLERR
jgi:hypothetical protein